MIWSRYQAGIIYVVKWQSLFENHTLCQMFYAFISFVHIYREMALQQPGIATPNETIRKDMKIKRKIQMQCIVIEQHFSLPQ